MLVTINLTIILDIIRIIKVYMYLKYIVYKLLYIHIKTKIWTNPNESINESSNKYG